MAVAARPVHRLRLRLMGGTTSRLIGQATSRDCHVALVKSLQRNAV
jgi:hypothetical protein